MEKLADRTGKQAEVKEQCHHGNEMTEEELEEHFRAFQEVEECIEGLKKEGDDI